MKKLILTLVMAMTLVPAMAQQRTQEQIDREAALEPEFNGQAAILNDDSTTTMLPDENAKTKGGTNALNYVPLGGFFAKDKTYLTFEGTESKAWTKPGDVRIILKAKDNDDDPKGIVGFETLEVKKKYRRCLWMSFNVIQGLSMDSKGSANYTVRKFGKSSYLITVKDLQPGQYAIGCKGALSFATFGVR